MLELTAEAEIYTRGVTIMKRTLAVLIICGLMLSGCGKTETDGAELRAGKTESASAVSTVTNRIITAIIKREEITAVKLSRKVRIRQLRRKPRSQAKRRRKPQLQRKPKSQSQNRQKLLSLSRRDFHRQIYQR